MFEKFSSKLSNVNNFKELSSEEEDLLEKNLVWIFSDRRSGTTWLGMELLSHQTKFIDEPLIGLHLGYFEPSKDGIKLTLEVQHERQDYFFSDKYKDVWKIYLRKLILNRIHSQIQDLSKTIIIKEPTGSLASVMIAECLPNAKIIVILRDGRDVLDSKIDSKQSGGWATSTGHPDIIKEKRLGFIKSRSQYWVKMMQVITKCYDNHDKNLRFLLKYEELLKNTHEILQKIYDFIGIKIQKEELEKIIERYSFKNIPEKDRGSGKFRRFATPGKWKENFSDEEVKIIEKVMFDTLQDLGYE